MWPPSVSGRYEGKAFFKAEKWPLIKAVRKVCNKDGQPESEYRSDTVAPVRQMQHIAEMSEPRTPSLEDKKVYKLMENVETIGDAP